MESRYFEDIQEINTGGLVALIWGAEGTEKGVQVSGFRDQGAVT